MAARRPETTGVTWDWYRAAACLGMDTNHFYPTLSTSGTDSPATLRAKAVCGRCPAARECLATAMREEAADTDPLRRHGIRGGLTPRQRLAIHNGRQP